MSSKAVQSKCIQNVLTNDWYCKWSAAEPMLHAVKKLSISLSCPAAKTRITDLVSGKVQQVQRPRWHHMAPSSGGGFNRTWCFHSVVNWFVLMWLMDGDGWSSRSPSLSQTSDQGTEVPEGFEAKCWPQRSAVTAVKSGPQLWGSLAKVSAPESLMRLRVKSRPETSLRLWIWMDLVWKDDMISLKCAGSPSRAKRWSWLQLPNAPCNLGAHDNPCKLDIIINHHCIWIIIIIIINHQYISYVFQYLY